MYCDGRCSSHEVHLGPWDGLAAIILRGNLSLQGRADPCLWSHKSENTLIRIKYHILWHCSSSPRAQNTPTQLKIETVKREFADWLLTFVIVGHVHELVLHYWLYWMNIFLSLIKKFSSHIAKLKNEPRFRIERSPSCTHGVHSKQKLFWDNCVKSYVSFQANHNMRSVVVNYGSSVWKFVLNISTRGKPRRDRS